MCVFVLIEIIKRITKHQLWITLAHSYAKPPQKQARRLTPHTNYINYMYATYPNISIINTKIIAMNPSASESEQHLNEHHEHGALNNDIDNLVRSRSARAVWSLSVQCY